ncbi:TPA: hypothetical protein F6U59_07330 [Serratia marcescens]|nr:hypothetical protein [Serratia marcescens]
MHNNDKLMRESPAQFAPMEEARRVLMIVDQTPDGKISFIPAGMLYHNETSKLHANTSPKPEKEGKMQTGSFQSFLKWVGLSLPIVVTIVGSTYWINATIDSKARDNRLELKADLSEARQDILLQVTRTQDSVLRLSDRTDEKFDKINDKLTEIHSSIKNNSK